MAYLNGKKIAFSPRIAMVEGGLKLINSMTVEEGQAPTAFQFTLDKDGEPFALKHIIVVAETYQPNVGSGFTFALTSTNKDGVNVTLASKWMSKKYNCFLIDIKHLMGVTTSIICTDSSDTEIMPTTASYPYVNITNNKFADDELITNITLALGYAMGAGSHIEIWGA